MRLKNLNTLTLRAIKKNGLTKAECSRILKISPQLFHYKINHGLLSWEQVKKLRLPVPQTELKAALHKDLGSSL